MPPVSSPRCSPPAIRAARRTRNERPGLEERGGHCRVAASAAGVPAPAGGRGLYFPTSLTQAETDEYTRYELLAPETASFRITYEVTATTAGAKYFYNPIRKGSIASDESVRDARLGTPLHFEVVSGTQARTDPL